MPPSSLPPTKGNPEYSFGVIPCRRHIDGTWEFLLIKNFRGEWGFPKGHPEAGETPHTTAIRELFEETSLEVAEWLLFSPFVMSYVYGGSQAKEVHLFPALVKGEAKPLTTEIDQIRWVNLETGEELATFGETKQIFITLHTLFRSS